MREVLAEISFGRRNTKISDITCSFIDLTVFQLFKLAEKSPPHFPKENYFSTIVSPPLELFSPGGAEEGDGEAEEGGDDGGMDLDDLIERKDVSADLDKACSL